MAHNLNFEDGEASMMFVGNVPWHGLGTQLETAPATAADAIRAAHLDWEVGLKPVYCMEGGVYYKIPGKRAIVRLDKWGQPDCQPFALVGDDYQVLQNREAFSFFDPIIKTGAVTFETAGALGKGERIWVLGKVGGDPIEIKKKDVVEKYLLFSTGHDAKTAVQIRFTPVRVVCQNTLVASLEWGTDFSKIYHIPGMKPEISKAQEGVLSILTQYNELKALYERFAGRLLTQELLDGYLNAVFPDPKRRKGQTNHSYDKALSKVRAIREQAAKLFEGGKGNDVPEIRGTLWAAYNGVVELVDHYLAYSSGWQRLESIWFGEGEHTKQVALTEAKKILATAA